MTAVPFSYIPANLLLPGFFFEVQPHNNTGLLPFQALLMGQTLSTGSLGPTNVVASGATVSGETLHFSAVPANIVAGMNVIDLTTDDVIAANTTVVSTTSTTVTISAAVLSGGVAESDVIQFSPPIGPVLVTSTTQALGLFGPGSQLANMCAAFIANNPITTLYALPLIDNPAGVQATGTITITGTVTQTSTLALYVAGVSVPVILTSTMTSNNIAAAIVAAINANTNLPVTASGSSFPVTITANNAGLEGNSIDVRLNYYGAANGELTPSGLVFTFSGMASGTEDPVLTAPLASLGDLPANIIGGPYTGSAALASIQSFLNEASGRWSWESQLFGHYVSVADASVGTLTTLGQAQNFQFMSILGLQGSPTPPSVIAAALTAVAAQSLSADPGLPLNTLQLGGVLAPSSSARFTAGERQTLLTDGISTYRVPPQTNNVIIDRMVTTYTTNAFDQPDNSYQNMEQMFVIAYIINYTVSILSSQYARVKLAADGTRIPVGSNIVTPAVIAGSLIAIYGNLVTLGLAQNYDGFVSNVYVVIDAQNPNRVNVIMPVTPISQLDTTAIALQLVVGGTS